MSETFVDSTELFYIQDTRGCWNCLLWWCPDGQGYTTDIDKAWKVDSAEAARICRMRPGQDVAWPAHLVEQVARRHVVHGAIESTPLGKLIDSARKFPGGPAAFANAFNELEPGA
jgi:hypothetical protein